jgi:hypothetical protein
MTSTFPGSEILRDRLHEVDEPIARHVDLGDHLARRSRRPQPTIEIAVVAVRVIRELMRVRVIELA